MAVSAWTREETENDMGRFSYEGQTHVDLDDRALAHLQMVVANKLRRGEPFYFTWKDDPSIGHGRTSVWVHPGCNMVFTYHGGRRPPLNRVWIEALSQLANTPAGLRLIPEPAQVDEMQFDDSGHIQ